MDNRFPNNLVVQTVTPYSTSTLFQKKKTDCLAIEEPLEIIINYPKDNFHTRLTLAVTMRTPGHDEELATGFLFAEGLIKNKSHIDSLARDNEAPRLENTIVVTLTQVSQRNPDQLHRHFFTNSSCGVCGKTSIQALEMLHRPQLLVDTPTVSASVLCQLPGKLRQHQAQFDATGGVHSAALFSTDGQLLCLREDVGRHNALDKLIGSLLLGDQLPLATQALLLVSGRSSFELVQKALMADIPILAAIGAPTSLACQLASRHGMTLVGFLKETGFNIYNGPERIV